MISYRLLRGFACLLLLQLMVMMVMTVMTVMTMRMLSSADIRLWLLQFTKVD